MPDGYQSMNGLDKGVDKTKEIQLSYNILKKINRVSTLLSINIFMVLLDNIAAYCLNFIIKGK